MLNVPTITSAMRKLGLSQATLADACDVSREAVSKWLNKESLPRPRKLAVLAEKLQLSVDELLGVVRPPEPIVAYRTRQNRSTSDGALTAGLEVGLHLQELLQYVERSSMFEPPVLRDPSLDEVYIQEAAAAVRKNLGLGPTDVISREQLFELFHDFGAYLVPVSWGGDKEGHENAMSVYLPESKSSFVLFNLGCRQDDFKYWLAHEYGHCLTLHTMQGDDGEKFAEKFAQHLLFPDELATQALLAIRAGKTRAEALAAANWFAGKYDVSVITVVGAADRAAKLRGEKATELATRQFYAGWKAVRKNTPTMTEVLYGSEKPSSVDFVKNSERLFRTPVFQAVRAWQDANGGRSPAFIASAFNVSLGQAVELSKAV
ncbi:helix-turn-helix domain-containing protein [Hydrogenophaga sp.]|uniref:helix-turn-helix domain-containing protein n=1 Tax=Hydrogenophaga sp. TaxID=1904254 RepID=UPI0027322917|nr:helix-turn-helix transcriptional regulator [Hydrogenophaga sp.]MDP2016309.1 helix-turn-helix transcriptional regulator [Hydrogenophaga sp.]MDP3166520.1 helix-turn-helix transcriptional regulator [Hydrogenophaga sp.]